MTVLLGSLVIGLLCFVVVGVSSSVVRYDQSQSGDVNVQVHLKNIEVFAILDDALLGEYSDYDYAELTEKPPKPSGSHNISSNSSYVTKPPTYITSNKPADPIVAEEIFYNIVSNITSRPLDTTSTSSVSSTSTESTTESTTTTVTPTTAKTTRRCGQGFYRDTFGRCRRIRRPHLPLLGLGYQTRNHKAAIAEDGTPTVKK